MASVSSDEPSLDVEAVSLVVADAVLEAADEFDGGGGGGGICVASNSSVELSLDAEAAL
ncbi:hypothetical protein [Pleomorphomonas sp. PLEO]|uniref:hypothetical protein n=1 Tax=Pleomorphomonas sp. PLEO TaxID=3239306 RepID=UPI00351DDABE